MTEVTEEMQAQMAVKLAESVRDLVRKEMLAAFEDPAFVNNFMNGAVYYFADQLATKMVGCTSMQQGVKQIIIMQMNKY